MLVPSVFNPDFVDDMFNDMFPAMTTPVRPAAGISGGLMKTDVKEFNNRYELQIDLPGYKKEDVEATLSDGYIRVKAAKNTETNEESEDGKFIHRERFQGQCSRSFYVGDVVTEEDITAKFTDGILKIEVPKKEYKPEETQKRIDIG